MGNHTTSSVYFLDHYRELEISWLTSYCIMNENIDNESLFVRKENANISWLLFKYCFDIRLPEKDFEDMYIFRQHIKRKFGWSIDLLENIFDTEGFTASIKTLNKLKEIKKRITGKSK